MKIKLIYALIMVLVLSISLSCKNKLKVDETDIKLVNKWNGKKIILPWKDLLKNFSGDSLEFKNIKNTELKIFTIIDTSCPSCRGDFNLWNDFINGINKEYIGFVCFLISNDQFLSIDEDILSKTFHSHYFKDVNNEIMKLNNIPNEKKYQTFLLDSKNNVILVGSPNQNNKMYNLYRDYIDKYYNEREISNVIKGTITTIDNGIVTTRFVTPPKYFLENGDVISKEKANELIKSLDYYPQINSITSEVLLVKRK